MGPWLIAKGFVARVRDFPKHLARCTAVIPRSGI